MKHILLITVLCFGCAVLLPAQDTNAKSSNEQSHKTVQTIRGCLSMTGHSYVLLGGTPMRQFRVIGGDLAALKGKQNHTVEITGPVGRVESGASSNGNYGPGSTTGVGYDTIRAQSVKDVYGNCG